MNNLSKKLQARFGSLEPESGLIDDCKYILYFADGYEWNGYSSVPVRSKREATEYLRGATATN